jgi:hypothetical protein
MRLARIIPRFVVPLFAAFALAACGGGDSSSPAATTATATPTPTPTATPTPTNVAAVTLDAGPSSLGSADRAFNMPFVTITICAPGSTSNCQTIDHVLLDTGSVGLRIIQPAIGAGLLAALPVQAASSGDPVGECYQFVTSYAFGSVRLADFRIGGETVAAMPFQAAGDTGAFATVPGSCSSGGGSALATVASIGANGILGIGTTATDCGTICQTAGHSSGAIYYDCPASGCDQVIARIASSVAPFQQLPNPVAAFALDNNGTILTLPTVPPAGLATLNGTLVFGIGTQPNNALTAATILTLTSSTNRLGPGFLTATFNGASFPQSYLDTGSSVYYFEDSSLTACPAGELSGFYCPASPISLTPSLTGVNGATANAAFTLYNPNNLAGTINVAPGLGINPQVSSMDKGGGDSFAFGIPFYFGRTVFTAIEGVNAGGTQGPYVGF